MTEELHRRSIRLKGYDYSAAGGYYVTMVAFRRECLFGEIMDGEMRLNALGRIVREEWFKTAALRPYVELREDEFVVMPNHVHGIIWIMDGIVGTASPCPYGGTIWETNGGFDSNHRPRPQIRGDISRRARIKFRQHLATQLL